MKSISQTIFSALLTVAVIAAPVGYIMVRDMQDSKPVVPDAPDTPVNPSIPACPDDATPDKTDGAVDSLIGEMVKLSGVGESVAWACVPAVPDMVTYGERNENCVLSFTRSGSYTVVTAGIVDGRIQIDQTEIRVGVPKPDPTNPNAPAASDWDIKIKSWLSGDTSPERKAQAVSLAKSFREVAAEVQNSLVAGKLITVDDMISRTVAANKTALAGSKLDWSAFKASLSAEFEAKSEAGELTTMQDHIIQWNQVADALDSFASSGVEAETSAYQRL
jgi:hypothetical protein